MVACSIVTNLKTPIKNCFSSLFFVSCTYGFRIDADRLQHHYDRAIIGTMVTSCLYQNCKEMESPFPVKVLKRRNLLNHPRPTFISLKSRGRTTEVNE